MECSTLDGDIRKQTKKGFKTDIRPICNLSDKVKVEVEQDKVYHGPWDILFNEN